MFTYSLHRVEIEPDICDTTYDPFPLVLISNIAPSGVMCYNMTIKAN